MAKIGQLKGRMPRAYSSSLTVNSAPTISSDRHIRHTQPSPTRVYSLQLSSTQHWGLIHVQLQSAVQGRLKKNRGRNMNFIIFPLLLQWPQIRWDVRTSPSVILKIKIFKKEHQSQVWQNIREHTGLSACENCITSWLLSLIKSSFNMMKFLNTDESCQNSEVLKVTAISHRQGWESSSNTGWKAPRGTEKVTSHQPWSESWLVPDLQ